MCASRDRAKRRLCRIHHVCRSAASFEGRWQSTLRWRGCHHHRSCTPGRARWRGEEGFNPDHDAPLQSLCSPCTRESPPSGHPALKKRHNPRQADRSSARHTLTRIAMHTNHHNASNVGASCSFTLFCHYACMEGP
ncbi:hypothetical protein L1887_49723 [Cichorium endivia]|nr:hypothetical protein L1887_49723 [Cichorium endivia]